jgi:serine/threonine-protein kinase
MAEVFLARRRVGGVEKRLVVKRLRRDHQRDPRFLEMFVREAQLSMSLVHQNIVPVFDFGRIGDDVFLAMEHIDGKDLGSTLARDRTAGMPPLLAAFVAHECCEALDHAHSRPDGVTHRDVTPRNVLLSWRGEVKLADFGIAAVVGEVAGSFGTPGYMAPEQANALRCDARADVYALGIVLWESLIGTHVRPTGDRQATVDAARSGKLPEIADSIPAELATIIRRATARAPDERYASARDMAEALDNFIVAERARTVGPTPAKRLAEWLRVRWGDARDETGPVDEPVVPDGFVSFLDDGADNVRGSHTERSVAETAPADVPEPEPPRANAATAPAALATPEPVPVPAPVPVADASRRRWVLIAVALALVSMIVIAVTRGDRNAVVADAGVAIVVPDAAAHDAVIVIDIDAPLVDAPPDATPPDAPSDAGRAPIDAGHRVLPPRDAVRPAVLRPIVIGATPWAYFTVDDSPTQHETPKTLQLSVGSHRITFSNPQLGVSRTVTVDVPAEGFARHVEKMR